MRYFTCRSILEHPRQVGTEVEAEDWLAQHRQPQPSGRLHVSMPGDLANILLAPMLARFLHKHSTVQLEVDLSPSRVDLIGENFDLAIRIGNWDDDAILVARKLAAVFTVDLYASPAYLKE